MIPSSLRRVSVLPIRSVSHTALFPSASRPYSTAERTSDRVATNDPNPPKPVTHGSETNALPIDTQGLRDAPLQEMPEETEHQRLMQAPNRKEVWSRSQAPRDLAMSGPRFEQTIMGLQVFFPS